MVPFQPVQAFPAHVRPVPKPTPAFSAQAALQPTPAYSAQLSSQPVAKPAASANGLDFSAIVHMNPGEEMLRYIQVR
jgi:hypothetical protein